MTGVVIELSDTKRALLERLRGGAPEAARDPARPSPSRPDPDVAPLSSAQQRVWFIEHLVPGTAAYIMAYSLEVRGSLDVPALRIAVNRVVERHEALRASFAMVDGAPVQRIAPALDIDIAETTLGEAVGPSTEARIRELAEEHATRPFDLASGPLLRLSLLHVAPDRQILLLAFHHLVFDGWSKGIFMSELSTFYAAEVTGTPASPLPQPMGYGDYAHRRRGQDPVPLSEYWRARFADPPEPLSLPTDHPRPPVQSLRGGREWFHFDAELVSRLRAAGHERDATLFMTVLAGYSALLHRYTQQTSLAVGTPVAGREEPEWEEIIGFFVNTLALRVDLDADLTFGQLLDRVRDVCLGAFDDATVPFERMVDEFTDERGLDRNPLFQTMFVLESTPPPPLELPGATLSVRPEAHAASQFDLMLFLYEQDGELHGFLEYSSDLFEPATVRRMAGHLTALLTDAAARPDRTVGELTLLDDAEYARVVVEWNDTARDLGPPATLHELVASQAERTPDAPAVSIGEHTDTYRELAERVDRVAEALHERGVARGAVVGVHLERSRHLLPALLGVLQCGAAYLPLDPALPAARLAFMASDARVGAVISATSAGDWLPGDVPLVMVDALDGPASGTRRPAPGGDEESRAYVIYTSGSTGTPKGVAVSHRAIVNRLRWMQEEYRLTADDRVLQKTPIGFDVSVWELFWPLLAGAHEVLLEPDAHRDPLAVLATLRRRGITAVHFVPAMLRLFLAVLDDAARTDLRLVVCSGEALPADLVGRFHELRQRFAPRASLHNLYGPTEAAVDVTAWPCAPADADREPVPIGRPVANCAVYVLDPAGRPVPVGVPGELYIGGVQVADGYVGRPELTGERFVPDPFTGGTARLYRTGDRVRWRPDGVVEYLGRLDRQVKVRGHRIELGEIEHAAAGHDTVQQAVAVVREHAAGEAFLVLYVVPPAGRSCVETDLRAHLRSHLPEQMLPRHILVLESFPLSSNGKIDQRALPEPHPGQARPAAAAGDAVTTLLTEVWQEALGRTVDVDTNFFEVGGDSIQCVHLVLAARERGLAISPQDVFQNQTIAELARVVTAAVDAGVDAEPRQDGGPEPLDLGDGPLARARSAAAGDIVDAYPLTPLQQHMLRRITEHPEPGLYMVQRVFRLRGSVDVPALFRAWQALVARHAILRTSFHRDAGAGTGPLQAVHRSGLGRFDYRDLRPLPDEVRAARLAGYLQEDRDGHWELGHPAPMRVRVFELPDADLRFAVTFNYMLVDGWSLGLLMRDLFTLYAAEREAATAELPPVVPFRTVVDWLASRPLEPAAEFWRSWLDGVDRSTSSVAGLCSSLSDGHSGPSVAELPFTRQHRYVGADVTRRLAERAKEWRVTLNTLVQSAWAMLLAARSGTHDVVFGVTSSGRAVPVRGAADVVGPCINTLPTRFSIDPDRSLPELLHDNQLRHQEARSFEHVSQHHIAGWLGADRDGDGGALFDHYLIFQNLGALMEAGELPGLALVDEVPVFHTKMEFPLRIDIFPGSELGIFFSYHRRVLPDDALGRLLDDFTRILGSLSRADESRPTRDLLDEARS